MELLKIRNLVETITDLFNLRHDTDETGTSETIRKNVEFRSTNAWTLVFAIFVASIGLNVNSAAVIIGAMLISPLMGPIVGAGFALGINDNKLMRKAIRNLIIAVIISVLTSTMYFLLSPLSEEKSELLARTWPTFYDVLIAFFGGATGIVASSRRERGNEVAGVAIATALMPPLCTAGFGLAHGNWKYFIGATYLFTINSVFICLSTFIFVRYLKFKKVDWIDKDKERKINKWVTIVALVVIIPSLIMAWSLMKESSFSNRASSFVKEQFNFPGTFVVAQEARYRFNKSYIKVDILGKPISDNMIIELKEKMKFYNLENSDLDVRQYVQNENDSKNKNSVVDAEQLKFRLSELEEQIKETNRLKELDMSVLAELKAFSFTVSKIATSLNRDNIWISWSKKPTNFDKKKIEDFLKVRFSNKEINFIHVLDLR